MRTTRKSSRGARVLSTAVTVGVLILIIAIIAGDFIISKATRQTIVATVTDKDIKKEPNNSSSKEDKKESKDVYMVYTKDENGEVHVFKNEDTWYYFKFNSSDVYAEIEIGKTYEFDVYGLRIPFFSSYQNIIKVKEVYAEQQSRAEAVAQDLIQKGISPDRIIVGGSN